MPRAYAMCAPRECSLRLARAPDSMPSPLRKVRGMCDLVSACLPCIVPCCAARCVVAPVSRVEWWSAARSLPTPPCVGD